MFNYRVSLSARNALYWRHFNQGAGGQTEKVEECSLDGLS